MRRARRGLRHARYSAVAVIALAPVVAVLLHAPQAQAQAGIAASAERGQKLFVEKMCYTCHGYAGQGGERGSGPRLAPNVFPLVAFAHQVRHPRQDMPRYSARFVSDAELADMHAYLSSLPRGAKASELPALRD